MFGPGWTELYDVDTASKLTKKVMRKKYMKHLHTSYIYIQNIDFLLRFLDQKEPCFRDCDLDFVFQR